jgi:hypothetical protein
MPDNIPRSFSCCQLPGTPWKHSFTVLDAAGTFRLAFEFNLCNQRNVLLLLTHITIIWRVETWRHEWGSRRVQT